jgi:hypothetical protein
MRRATLLGLGLATACTVDPPFTTDAPRSGTLADFGAHVQPVLSGGCASLDCHGDAGRPLRLYARDGLRLAADLRGHDPTEDELVANMDAIAGLGVGRSRIEDDLLLLKPLSVAAGGVHHVGGDLWADQSDPAYRCLHAWLRDGASDAMAQAICASVTP